MEFLVAVRTYHYRVFGCFTVRANYSGGPSSPAFLIAAAVRVL